MNTDIRMSVKQTHRTLTRRREETVHREILTNASTHCFQLVFTDGADRDKDLAPLLIQSIEVDFRLTAREDHE